MKKDVKKMGRRSALEDLRKKMREMEGEGIKKVTVAAPDSDSLEKGLEMAKEKVKEMEDMSEESENEESEEKEEKSDLSDKSKEELLDMIKELM